MISVEEIRKLLANSQESINMTSAEEIREFLKSLQESIEDEVYSGDLEKIDKIVEDFTKQVQELDKKLDNLS